MKKVLIVINSYSISENIIYKSTRLKEELLKYKIESDIVKANQLLVKTKGNELDLEYLTDYYFAIYLDKDNYLAKAISLKIPLYNNYESLILSDDKMLSILNLYNSNIKAPLTISCPLCYIDEPKVDEVKLFLDDVEKALSYPMVFKLTHGSLGKQVFLINNRKELEEYYSMYKKVPHIYEEYLNYHIGDDYRVIVVGDEVIASMERVNKNDFRSNIALGGKGYDVTNTLNDSYKQLAIKAAKCLKLDYAGIDIAKGKDDEPIFIEANGNAFFTEIEKVTSINIASHFIKYILRKEKIID